MLVEKTGRCKFRAIGTGLPNVRDSVPTARTTAHNYIFYQHSGHLWRNLRSLIELGSLLQKISISTVLKTIQKRFV